MNFLGRKNADLSELYIIYHHGHQSCLALPSDIVANGETYAIADYSSLIPGYHILGLCAINRSGAAADWRTLLQLGAQLDLASSYAVPRTESPTSLNYAKLCVELNHTGAAIGEMWGDRARRQIVFE